MSTIYALLDEERINGNDWRELARNLGYSDYCIILKKAKSPTDELLKIWYQENPKGATVSMLQEKLEKMRRYDVLEHLSANDTAPPTKQNFEKAIIAVSQDEDIWPAIIKNLNTVKQNLSNELKKSGKKSLLGWWERVEKCDISHKLQVLLECCFHVQCLPELDRALRQVQLLNSTMQTWCERYPEAILNNGKSISN